MLPDNTFVTIPVTLRLNGKSIYEYLTRKRHDCTRQGGKDLHFNCLLSQSILLE